MTVDPVVYAVAEQLCKRFMKKPTAEDIQEFAEDLQEQCEDMATEEEEE